MIILIDKIREYIKDDEFRLTIFKNQLHIINYLEILTLSNKQVSIDTGSNLIVIHGENLILNKLLDNEILITGKIYTVEELYD